MPYFCRSVVSQALNHARQRSLKGSRILVLGVAYKPDISDTRESPAVKLIALLENAGRRGRLPRPARPLRSGERRLDELVAARAGALRLRRRRDRSIPGIDYDQLVEDARLVVDLRNATGANGKGSDKVWKL